MTATALNTEQILWDLADTLVALHGHEIRELAWSYACKLAYDGEEQSAEKALELIAEFEQDIKERYEEED